MESVSYVSQASAEVKALMDAMSALSEQLFQAFWHEGCELPIWMAMTSGTSVWCEKADKELLVNLRLAWLKVHGWVIWDERLAELTWITDQEWFQRRNAQEAGGA
jgi:hypothetical protein